MKKKPIGYTAEQTKSMKKLIERTEPKSGDYVGSGTVTEVPKKKKPKRMMDGGMAMRTPMVGKATPMGSMMPRRRAVVAMPVARPMMRGGGLARKGVGQALAAGGAVRACGVAKRGKTKGKMV